MNKMYAMVLFLVVITSTSSVSFANTGYDDQKIAMVVQTTTLKSVEEADIPLQIGRFKVKDGNLLTLLRPVESPTPNCVGLDVECGAFTAWCCEGLHCGPNYRCVTYDSCENLGEGCALLLACCWPYHCNASSKGKCVENF